MIYLTVDEDGKAAVFAGGVPELAGDGRWIHPRKSTLKFAELSDGELAGLDVPKPGQIVALQSSPPRLGFWGSLVTILSGHRCQRRD